MYNVVTTENFWPVSVKKAWEILKNLEHTYGEASSVCDIADHDQQSSSSFDSPYEMGVIEMLDLGLSGNTNTYKDVVEKSLEQGYLKVFFSDVINYVDRLPNHNFYRQTAIMSIMDRVTDGEGDRGMVYMQPDEEGFLYGLGFINIDESQGLSPTARFLVKKIKEVK